MWAAEGQQTSESEPAQSCANQRRRPAGRINRAIARQSSPSVVSQEQACHAGGRGFESRRSRKSTCKSLPFLAARPPAFRASRTDPARESAGNPRGEPVVAANPRKRTTGLPGRRSVGHRSRSLGFADFCVIATHNRAQHLRIGALTKDRRSDEITESHGYGLPHIRGDRIPQLRTT
jgi:hypothetical protein